MIGRRRGGDGDGAGAAAVMERGGVGAGSSAAPGAGAGAPGSSGAAAATARRFTPAPLRDARWIVGVLLLALGVAGTLRVISGFDDSVAVWAAKSTLTPGQRLGAADVVRTRVHLDRGNSRYVLAEGPAQGIVQRVVGAGELIPSAALGDASGVSVRSVSVTLERGQADVVRAGADVEVWVAAKVDGAGTASYEKPEKIIDRALVARIGGRTGGVVAVSEGQPVEILVPKEALADVIDAVNSGSRITLVPLVGAGRS